MSDAAADALDAVRRDVAAARGLDEAALPFIGGTTVDEIEASAERFVALIGKRETHEQRSSSELFTDVARHQALRKRALVETLLGRAEQPRDAGGRWSSAPSFDGGARADGDMPEEPESHDQLIGRLLASRAADVGARGF